MESVTIYSNDDLSSLWVTIKDRFPDKTIQMQKKNNIIVKKQYLEEFCNLFSVWYHKNIWKVEVETLLREAFMLTPDEEKDVRFRMPEFIQGNENELIGILKKKALVMLKSFQVLKMGGFSNFCLQEYRIKLEEIIAECLEQYYSEQDYYEFLNLLQYFVEVEEYQFGELIIVVDKNNHYSYYDETFQNITEQCMKQFFLEFEEENPTADDCLITVLILLLPKKITMYGVENVLNNKFLNTLKSIFRSRIEFRSGTDVLLNHKL